MHWPWARKASNERLILSWSNQTLAYIHARTLPDGSHRLLKSGVESQGTDSTEEFVERLQALGLNRLNAEVMLRSEQYQFLTVDAPAVPDEELRSAVPYQIKSLLTNNLDDVTLDLMRVGSGQQEKQSGQLFVVAADNLLMRNILALGEAMHWHISLIDVQETAQCNLQTALAEEDGRATAALVSSSQNSMILTISAHGQLFYTGQYDLPEESLVMPLEPGNQATAEPSNTIRPFAPVTEEISDDSATETKLQGFLSKVQRSLDIWNRSWASMPLNGIRVYAGDRSEELSTRFALAFGQTVLPMDVSTLFPEFDEGIESEKALCLPLLGILIRASSTLMPQGINLLNQLQATQQRHFLAQTMFQAAVVCLLVIAGFSTYWLSSIESAGEEVKQSMTLTSQELDNLQAQIRLKQSGSEISSALVRELEASRAQLLQRESIGRQRQLGRFSPGWGHGARLRLIAETIPAQVWVTEMIGGTEQFTIRGFTLGPTALGEWVAVLSASPLFEGQRLSDVNLENTSSATLNNARPMWSFSLISQMSTPSVASAVSL